MGILRTDKISGLETPTAVTGSVVFDGTGDYLQITPDEDFAFANNDFTIETWAYFNTVSSGSGQIYEGRPSGTQGAYVSLYFSADNTFSFYTDSAVKISGTVTASRWYHIALVRNSGTTTLYLDGISQGTYSDSQSYLVRSDGPIIGVARNESNNPLDGYLSNYRILRGTALYTSDFTPPTHALEVIGDTVLLCCNNSDSAGADGTGKTVTVNGDAAASTFSPGLTRDFTYGTEFKGVTTFDTQGYFVPPSGTTEQRGRGRGLFGAGSDPSKTNSIDYVNINSTGNAQDFGDLTEARDKIAAAGSSTRGLFAGGDPSSNTIAYVTLATTGNALNFGDLPYDGWGTGAVSNNIRWLNFGDYSTNRISYVTMSTLGDAQDFGDLLTTGPYHKGCGSPVRAIIYPESGTSVIQFLTFASLGNAVSFGEKLDSTQAGFGAASDSTRAIRFGGRDTPGGNTINAMGYVTIASTGNAQDFGDLTSTSKDGDATSNSIRAVHNIGESGSVSNAIDYVTIQTTGNAKDFGDLTTQTRTRGGTTSDSHGGIS